MLKSSHRVVLMVMSVAAMVATARSAAERRTITEDDLLAFVWVADPQMAPDGARVAFVRVTADRQKDQYDSAIWIVRTDGVEPPRPLTAGTRDTAPRWSPDGSRLAFVRSSERDGRAQPPQIYVMAMAAGEPRAITDLPRGAAAPVWSPDGKTIAFSSGTRADEIAPQPKLATSGADAPEKRKSDVRVISDAAYRANGVAGSGFVDRDHPSHVWTVTVPDPSSPPTPAKQVTAGVFSESNHQWSLNGSQIYFTSDRRGEPYYYSDDSDIYSVSRNGGEPRPLASIDGSIGAFAIARDGKRLAFVGNANARPERSYDQPDLFVVDLAGGPPRNLTADYDFDVSGALSGDQRAPRGQLPAAPIWTEDGSGIVIRVGERGTTRLVTIDAATGGRQRSRAFAGESEILSYTADRKGQHYALVLSTPVVLGDLHVTEGTAAAPKKITSFNDELFGRLEMKTPEEISYTSFDGRKIQGWILNPPGFDAAKKYPLIVQIHGGPHAAYGSTFTHEFQWMAARGYVVFYANPRGSSNYGQEFGNIIQFNYPGDDYKDIMAGVDEVLKKGYVDRARMGVTGGSGGGLLTNWVVTQTTRFRAAVSQRDIADWSTFWYTADFTLFRPTWFRKAPFEDPAEFARRSPITYAERIQTPLMFILGDEDWRTPPGAGGEDLFRALKYLKRPTVMVRFPAENHELSRSGRPWHRIERLQHIVGWFDKYLLDKNTEAYQP